MVRVGLAFVLALTVALRVTNTQAGQTKRNVTPQSCSAKSDVVFVVDSSDSVSAANLQKELDFVKHTVRRWDVDPNGLQVGLVSFGSSAQGVFNLNSHIGGQRVVDAMATVPKIGGTANLQEALRYATDNMFTPQSGVRAQTSKVVVLVTDNRSPNKDLTILQGQTTQNNDIQVYTVGVGAGVNDEELKGVASNPASRYYYHADNFDAVNDLSKILGPKICNEVPQDAAFLPPPTGCLQKADLVFLLDSSSTIGKDNFRKVEDFTKDVVQDLNISPDGVHVGVMQYSSYPSFEFPLSMHTSRYDVLKAVDNVNFMGGGANTADALDYMRRMGFSQNSGARPGVPRIGVVITDGSSPNSAQVAIQANNARLDNIGLIAVGVGPTMNTAELQSIADDPDSNNMFTVTDFNNLPSITANLIDAMCRVDATVPPNTMGSSGTAGPDPCQDVVNCPAYGNGTQEVCSKYAEWSKINCARYCGHCIPLYTSAPPQCDDAITNCASYGLSSCSGAYYGWALQNCKRYCGYCGMNTQSLGYHGSCSYKGHTYTTGEKWMDGCDYECICEDGNSGKYRCYNRCPVYHNLPSQCTLVKNPSTCCLEPQCNFQQTINTVQGSTHGSVHGINTCEYKGQNYFQGQQWQDGCDYQCTCTDSRNGHYECHDLCPKYPGLPSYCHLEMEAGSCCAKPVCEFDMQQGSFSGLGTVSGNGIDTLPPTLPPCVDVVDNCAMYGKGACQQYRSWSLLNCRRFCDSCDVDRDPGPDDVCIYEGKQYHQGESWFVGCNMRCTCEKATQGFYRCDDLCPTYTNVPPTCKSVKLAGECCATLQCGSGTFISSTNNLNTVGNGGTIFTGPNYVPPTLVTGGQAPPGTGDSTDHAPSIPGCLYKGQVYVQGQRWEDGCDLSCQCDDAATGRYKCRVRCPTYSTPPAGCTMMRDEADTCCLKPHCTGPAALTYTSVPVYGQYQSRGHVAQPPSINERFPSTGGNFGPHSGVATAIQYGTTVPPPTVGNYSAGGIGYCFYAPLQQRFNQDQTWEDGCDYNCVCDDASYGHYTCVEKCVKYTNIPEPYCHLVQDPANACCQIPQCMWTAPYEKVTGLAVQNPTTPIVHTTVPPTPAFAFCEYNGKHYDKNQIWFQGCDFKCMCEEPATNNYRCVSRCPEYENLDASCSFEPDPEDPTCCSVPRCGTPSPGNNLVPNPTEGAVTVRPGFVTGDNFPPGVTGGTVTGYCEYNGQRYQQGETWEDGCQYNCVCEDITTGKYKCTEKCVRYDKVPPGCRLVSDFTNPCCQKLRCDPNSVTDAPTPGTTGKPDPNNPHPTIGPTPGPDSFCVYNNVQYRQNEEWKDGCDKNCRCDNAATGIYSCTQRCMSYDTLPPECKLVTDPSDQCCLVPQCGVPVQTPTQGPPTQSTMKTPPPMPGVSTQSPAPNGNTVTPSPFTTPAPGVLFPTPTAVPGKVTGAAEYPPATVGPNGETPTPRTITYCEYKGVQYQQADKWTDGCTFNCECVNALQGKYECTERCPRYPSLPAECRLVKNIADPCCLVPECGPSPTSPSTTKSPVPNGQTVTPLPGQPTNGPDQKTTQAPPTTQKDVCVYKGQTYSQGQQWYDGCDYKCLCENGPQGLYTCSDRCSVYDSALPTGCTMVADPADPFCCKVPECKIPPRFTNSSGFVFPTPPLAVVSGGSATPLPTPPQSGPTPSPGTVFSPIPGQSTTDAPPTIPNNVCVYNGRTYQQGQTWRDGCNYNCRCNDAMTGHYLCTEICPKNPPSLPPQCRLVRDSTNPCCMKPYCDFTQTTSKPTPGSTASPPTVLTGPTQYPPTQPGPTTPTPKPGVCVYNGVPFKQDDTWEDGCDLKCECEDASTGYYRCNQRCPRYDSVPAGCTLVADPRDSCCQVPLCAPVPSSTSPPSTPVPGSTLHPPTTSNPNNPQQSTSGVPIMIPTAIPGKIQGVGVTPTPGTTEKPSANNPFPTPAPTLPPGCLYKGVMYQAGQRFSDGCQYDCVCMDNTGKYTCTEKCPVYPSMPANCQLVNDPKDPCCKVPQCLPPVTNTPPPQGVTATPPTGQTVSPNPNNPQPTLTPPTREVCVYMGKTYTQGQQWDVGCSKVCVCENAMTGFYRCSDRCAIYDNIPAGCQLVADPNDPLCCQVPQCAPTANPQFPNPTSGPTVVVSPPLGKVTGIAPIPTPTTAHPGDTTPLPPVGCMYKGNLYRQNQQWQDGCDFNCICEDEVTGAYSCTQRCPVMGPTQPRCTLQPDPKDFCCVRQVCDFSKPTPTPGAPVVPTHPTTPAPYGVSTPAPQPFTTPVPTPPAVCVYQGVPYQQGASWKEGCSRTCRCEDAVNNLYTCFDRCPTYQLQPGCQMVTDPNDPCCQQPQCTVLATPVPTTPQPITPFPNGSYPSLPPSQKPSQVPVVVPSPVPSSIPGILTGTLPTPTGFCEYKGGRYTTGQSWIDGCDYKCECVDQMTGQYRCTQRCPPYPSIPPYCVMVGDPNDQCCQVPYCPGLLTPAPRSTPGPNPPITVNPATGPSYTGTGPTTSPQPTLTPPKPFTGTGQPPVTTVPTLFPTFNVPIPTGTSNPVPKDVCVFMGKAYTQGQQWYDACDKICVCEDGKTGFYSCTDRCPTYPSISPGCIMVADPKDPTCCQAPQCSPPVNPNVPPTGVVGVVTGSGLPPTPTPAGPTGPVPTPRNVCVYKGNEYTTGQTWQDGCNFECECMDDMTGQYRCHDRCPRYPNLPTTCVLVYDPSDPCCKKPLCGDQRPTPPPTQAPTTGPNGQTPGPQPTTPNPNAFCVYNGVAYRQGESWQVGCDKVCRCENAMTRQVTCTERCPSFPSIQDGCMLETDPLDSCCQVLNCPPKLQPGTDILVPPIRGVVTGGNQPKPNGIPSFISGPGTCVYNGQPYKQGQSWDDGCSYTCVCVDELNGKYRCTEKCPRFDSLPATCTLVQDPKDPCCKQAVCPDLKPPTITPPPSGGTTPPPGQQVPTPGSTPLPRDVCVYGNNYYKQGQQWYVGCDKVCRCEDTYRNFYRCDDRCAKFPTVPTECTMVPDPKDPSCCSVPECPVNPSNGPTFTGAGFVRPSVTPPSGVVTGDGKIPTPIPTPTRPGQTTPMPLPTAGCYYKNQVYQQGQKWDDGCDFVCECLNGMTGAYRCTDKCPPTTNALPDPVRCRMVQDPNNPCCPAPYCDFKNPVPVFPTPGSTLPGGTADYFTPPPQTGSGTSPPGFCVYQGVYYRQGDTWSNGCSQTCRCEDVTTGYYSCFERCKSFDNLPSNCSLKSDPADPCCVVPDCNIYPQPGQTFTNGQTPPPPTDKPVPIVGGSITGVGGTNPLGINPLGTNTGTRNVCVYKGVPYQNGQTWDDGCGLRCECIDASRGQYRCTDRCPSYYFLPAGCFYQTDPNDPCCKIASCTGTAPPSVVTPQGYTTPPTGGVVTVPQDMCVYRDGKQYSTGSTWNDGCSLSCKCDDGVSGKYSCTERCPVFSSLPTYCTLVTDPTDVCCKRPECSGHLTPLVGNGKPTQAPYLPPNVTNIVPLGTHVVINGRSPLTPGYTGPTFIGGRNACVYKNNAYRQGETWEDGCDYVCVCDDANTGAYTCTSKCPLMPPLPTYCKNINIPGQCCPSVQCNVPGHGTYNPIPELTAQSLPTPGPTQPPHGQQTTPVNQIIVPNQGPITGGQTLPGGGATVPPGTNVGGLRGKCVTDDMRMYNPGETWSVNCDYDCTCLDGRTGYYKCDPKCTSYSDLPPACTLVKLGCCMRPLCTQANGTTVDLTQNPDAINVFPVTSSTTGGFTGFRPGYLATVGNSFVGGGNPACIYKGTQYGQGETWDDGCDFSCRCEDAVNRQFLCKPKCPRFTSVPPSCRLVKDPQGCCDVLDCPVATTEDPSCKDPLPNCPDYGRGACVGDYEQWARRNCPHFCGYETCGGATTPPPDDTCEDKLNNCDQYGKGACVGEYLTWAKLNCRKYCDLCPKAGCKDLLPDCSGYGASACQPPYTEWAKINCNDTCGFCRQTHVVGAGTTGISGNNTGIDGVISGTTNQLGARGQNGWVTLLKGVHGIPNDDIFRLWASPETRNANNSRAMVPTADFPGHFKSALSNYWSECKFDEVKVSIWNNGQEKVNITFDARGTDKMNWFTPSRITGSSYSDIKTASHAMFSMDGDPSLGREFYISQSGQGCAGSGWIMISTQSQCNAERSPTKPSFFYTDGPTAGQWYGRKEGDVFMISGRGGSCASGNVTSDKPVCSYKGRDYRTGEVWQDGCDKNCTCVDGNLGFYQCNDLCRQFGSQLPQGCSLVKKPGDCCDTLYCPVHGHNGCYYKGSYYHQGDVWEDGCDYRCTCEDAHTGFYTCKARCVIWSTLPSECYLETAPQGKCCPVPKCPQGFVITYPPGYQPE